ncbi:MAG: alginate export family protein [bacterium]|nr:alginate export family protein [bacterium]
MTHNKKIIVFGIILLFWCGIYSVGSAAETTKPEFNFGGSIESRGWVFDGIADNQYSWAESEIYLWVSADLTEKVFAKLNLTNRHIWGKDDSFTIPSLTDPSLTSAPFTTGEEIQLWEGYLTLREIFNSNVSLTFGRILENYGEGFVISNNLPVDAVKANLVFGKTDLDLFVYKQVENIEDVSDRNLWGLYSQTKWNEALQLDAYLLYLQNRAVTPHQRLYTFGTRAASSIPRLPGLTLKSELAYQTGDEGDTDLTAWGGYVGGAYQFTASYKPAINLAYIYLSGDDNLLDDTDKNWNNLLGHSNQERLGQKAWGRIVDFNNGIKDNMKIFWVGASAQPTEKVKSDIDVYDYRYNKKSDNKSRHLGYEVDLKVAYQYTENVAAEVIGAWFNPTKDNNNEDVVAAKGAIKVSF